MEVPARPQRPSAKAIVAVAVVADPVKRGFVPRAVAAELVAALVLFAVTSIEAAVAMVKVVVILGILNKNSFSTTNAMVTAVVQALFVNGKPQTHPC